MTLELFPRLAETVQEAQASFGSIPDTRRSKLEEVWHFVDQNRKAGEIAGPTFICTHNSRRSHMAQIWAHTAAAVYGVSGVETFSGGTGATAFNRRAVAALRRAGFEIDATSEGDNPLYQVRIGFGVPPMEAFSKAYDAPPNPTQGYCAVMTCSDADANCPIVHGASARVAIPYDDPKNHDGSKLESEIYDERCRQIGVEMLYAFSLLG
jgi:arsenate reductase